MYIKDTVYHVVPMQFALGGPADDEAADIDDKVMETEAEAADEEEKSDVTDEEDGEEKVTCNGEGKVQEEPTSMEMIGTKNWKSRRQFNSALGISIDAPMSQPQTNAYDVHNNQQGSALWESPAGEDEFYVCYVDLLN